MVGKRTFNKPEAKEANDESNGDLESGKKSRRFGGFKDAVDYAMDRRTTAALREQLRKGVEGLPPFDDARKSDEEVSRVLSAVSRRLS